jgi:hypothetical protein
VFNHVRDVLPRCVSASDESPSQAFCASGDRNIVLGTKTRPTGLGILIDAVNAEKQKGPRKPRPLC